MADYNSLPDKKVIEKTTSALKANGIDAMLTETGKEAKEKVLQLIPSGAEVMNMSSVTLETIGVAKEIEQLGKYNAVRNKLMSMDRKTQGRDIQKLGAAPDFAVGSVHAVTQDGKVLIASNTGSQLPAYVYGSSNVIWVVGAQKIVKDLDDGIRRIYEYVLPLESKRAHEAYGVPGSFVSKLLIFNREIIPGRVRMILVHEVLGF